MGGKKKLGLKQMERSQGKRDAEEDKEKKKKDKAGASREKRAASITYPDAKSDKNVAELKKIGVLTPYAVATRFNMRISAAKDFLEELEHNGKIQLVSGSHNLKIYRLPD